MYSVSLQRWTVKPSSESESEPEPEPSSESEFNEQNSPSTLIRRPNTFSLPGTYRIGNVEKKQVQTRCTGGRGNLKVMLYQ
jgi:hypothetical protein